MKKQLWARMFHYDNLLYGIHDSLEKALDAERKVRKEMGKDNGNEFYLEEVHEVGTDMDMVDYVLVDSSNIDDVLDYCENTTEYGLFESKYMHDPIKMKEKLLKFKQSLK